MKTFNFDHSSFQKRNPHVQAFYRSAYHSGMSIGAYVQNMRALKKHSHCKHRASRYSPSHLKADYRRLKYKYGFFLIFT
jgi:hypothetical protein